MYSLTDIEAFLKQGPKMKLVFPEGNEKKIQMVAKELVNKKIAIPWLLFETKSQVPQDLNGMIKFLTMEDIDLKPFVTDFMALRGSKTTFEQAQALMKNRAYLGAMLCQNGQVDGMVCGLTFTTAETLRPALQIIKTQPGLSLASSAMILRRENENYLFTDCALNVVPNPQQLATIAKLGAQFANELGITKPEVALLSYSTKGSGFGPQVDNVQEAAKILAKDPSVDFVFDGEIQFDAAFDKNIRLKKAPETKITKNHPDIFVFPDLQSGNIGYKIAQRLANFKAAGPFILGLNKPVNDLSRGAELADIYETALITAFQAQQTKQVAKNSPHLEDESQQESGCQQRSS
ncbi:phosphate acetyltransferase [Entomoplasma freundtii]|uniref:Phosphate acetyltransferase n=1 Tax=Entomoplasma freundtii TaxID=74700 RepID=A0A2K8NQW3_9MOLU|nr:phosphate acetyltransferase [Entomoplasma freundtii]ATZ16230.1 phosphotransacetylase [Entomoplasma freundtii]TDY56869.1 phosphate acetyltransferase [Entomoplasma freundtii]